MRRRQKTEDFASLYSRQAGIEGTVSQGVRAFGLRKARYRDLKKTHLQDLATATAVNVGRNRQLAKRHPYRCYAAFSIGGTGSGELIVTLERINQQYPLRTLPFGDLACV